MLNCITILSWRVLYHKASSLLLQQLVINYHALGRAVERHFFCLNSQRLGTSSGIQNIMVRFLALLQLFCLILSKLISWSWVFATVNETEFLLVQWEFLWITMRCTHTVLLGSCINIPEYNDWCSCRQWPFPVRHLIPRDLLFGFSCLNVTCLCWKSWKEHHALA